MIYLGYSFFWQFLFVRNEVCLMFYFQLNIMVGLDIREIYEIKLRDWYLQKDFNFRWCVYVSIYQYILVYNVYK